MPQTQTIGIQAPPSVIWSVWSDLERWPEWTASITRIERLDSGPLAVGLRARVTQPRLPVATWRVTEADEGRDFTWETVSPGSRVIARHHIDTRAEGCRVTTSLTYEGVLGRIAGRLTRSLSERYLAMEAQGLKARCEALARTTSRTG